MLTQGRFFIPGSAELYEMLLLRVEGWSYPKIAQYYGKHHSTIVHHCKKWGVKPGGTIPERVKVNIVKKIYRKKHPNVTYLTDLHKYEDVLFPKINKGKMSYEEYKKDSFLRSVRNPQARLLYTKK